VPFPAGGPNDIIARVVGQRMSELTKQPVVIDNRGGQAGVLGTDAVAKAAPDGYTIGSSARARSSSARAWKRSPTTYAQGFRAGHAGRDRAGNAGGREQRSRQRNMAN
jgi:tripartite-type tricarboxylate transporter receptor subunit TctC